MSVCAHELYSSQRLRWNRNANNSRFRYPTVHRSKRRLQKRKCTGTVSPDVLFHRLDVRRRVGDPEVLHAQPVALLEPPNGIGKLDFLPAVGAQEDLLRYGLRPMPVASLSKAFPPRPRRLRVNTRDL